MSDHLGSEGKGYKSLADTLNQQGIATPRGPRWSYIYSGKWIDTTIRAMLINPVYAGDKVHATSGTRFHKIITRVFLLENLPSTA
jgi:hypothetical protein